MTITDTRRVGGLEVRLNGPRIGAEIFGFDLESLTDTDRLRALWDDRKVLVFRDAQLTPDQQVEAVRIFDEPFDHPTAIRHPDNRLVYPYEVQKTGKASRWHIGGLWRDPVFSIESLVYEVVPDIGGDTIWADLQAAYDDLSEPFKALVGSVSAIYDGNADHYAQGARREGLGATTEHPLVLAHPRTGRKGLFLSTGAIGLTGVTPSEGEALLRHLYAHASAPQYQVRYSWRVGDFVLWDNQATWHYAVDDYGDAPRAYRKVIAAAPSAS